MRILPLCLAACAFSSIPAEAASNKGLVRQFDRLDRNNDEILSLEEVSKLVSGYCERSYGATCEVIFAWFDADENGEIDLGEWLDGKTEGHKDLPDFTGEASLELDFNRNRKVSRSEFEAIIAGFVSPSVTKAWFAAQFPSGIVSGCAFTSTMPYFNEPVTVVGPLDAILP